MYDLPSRQDVKTFTITRELVEARSRAQVLTHPSAKDNDTADRQATA
jgi:ATP-dependent Clp protease ATP-binding subunit ClpX